MITYEAAPKNTISIIEKVFLEKKHVGYIYESPEGFYYAAKGTKYRGENFATVRDLKKSLEG